MMICLNTPDSALAPTHPSAPATSHAPAAPGPATAAQPGAHMGSEGQQALVHQAGPASPEGSHSRRSGGEGRSSGSVSRGSSILSLSDLSSNQADQGEGSSEGGDQDGTDSHVTAAAPPDPHPRPPPGSPQAGIHTFKVTYFEDLGFSAWGVNVLILIQQYLQ